MSGPAVSIVFGLEESPRVRLDSLDEGEQVRLVDWLEGHPEYLGLIDRAYELAETEQGA